MSYIHSLQVGMKVEVLAEGVNDHDDAGHAFGLVQGGTQDVTGLNEEYVDHLIGNNEKGVLMLSPDHPAINARGELVDRWGTPFFIHPLSDRLVEITSAGPDRVLFTDDDVRLD